MKGNFEWVIGVILFIIYVAGHVLSAVNASKKAPKSQQVRVMRVPRQPAREPDSPRATLREPPVLKPVQSKAALGERVNPQLVEKLRAKQAQAQRPMRRVAKEMAEKIPQVVAVVGSSPVMIAAEPAPLSVSTRASGPTVPVPDLDASFIEDLIGTPQAMTKALILQTILSPPLSRRR